jgi:hypothetical protein
VQGSAANKMNSEVDGKEGEEMNQFRNIGTIEQAKITAMPI